MSENVVQLNVLASFIAALTGDDGYLPLSVRYAAAVAALRVVVEWKEKAS